jgi:general secretion pathway protein I
MIARGTGERGFTLIEMIVSLAILSIALGVLFAAFSQDMTRQRLTEDETAARVEAQSVLARSLADPPRAPGRASGETADGLRWTLSVAPYGGIEDQKAWAFTPMQVTARVDWSVDGRDRSLSLTTLRAMPRAKGDAP